MSTKILMKNAERSDTEKLSVYRETGGYEALAKALKEMKPLDVMNEVRNSGIRGRGGAGFPMGLKWGFVPKDTGKPTYLICNADEGEPGTFKDRWILTREPHMLLEGMAIASYALNCHLAYIYIRGEFYREGLILEQAIAEAHEAGLLGANILGSGFDLEIHVHRGAGAYICGEETGLIESLEGKRGEPRLKPPFPAVIGLFNCPTVVNNVETLASVPWITTHGGQAYAAIGNENNTGTKLFSISGMVKRPGVYEADLGTTLRTLIEGEEYCQGLKDGVTLKAIVPGGSSTPYLLPEHLDVPMDFDSVAKAGSMLGSGAVVVIGEGTCMVETSMRVTRFYAHESCGQCTPCREGNPWLYKLLHAIEHGQGEPGDVELILDICNNMMGNSICPLADAAAMPAKSSVERFREEYEEHIRLKRCPFK